MAKKTAFVSFDYDNDEGLKIMLVGQAKHGDSPFDFKDGSVKEHLTGDWKQKAKNRMNACDLVIILCGASTHRAAGVSAELEIARELKKPYFLLQGYSSKTCYKPTSANTSDKMYNWTWDNLKALIGGSR